MTRQRKFPHRLLIVIPVGRIALFRTWWLSKARTGELPHDDPAQWVGVNASGNTKDAITHRMSCGVYTRDQGTVLLKRMAEMSGQAVPANWDKMTDDEKKIWTYATRDAVYTTTGVWIVPEHAERPKIDADTVLAEKSLKRPKAADTAVDKPIEDVPLVPENRDEEAKF